MTSDYIKAYFNNPDVWNSSAWQGRQADQDRARLADQWLPEEVDTVLDVGCGNGVYTNLSEVNRFKVGLDLSRIALKYVTVPRLQSDAVLLPFFNNSYDAVVSMEMIEHLPVHIYQDALNELVRVSRKHILITVPYKENLKHGNVTCPACFFSFHPYHHLRRYQQIGLKTLFDDQANLARLEAVVPTRNEALPALWNLIGKYEHRNGRNFPAGAICPKCGYTRSNYTVSNKQISQMKALRKSLHRFWPKSNTFTWWMAYYQKRMIRYG